MTNEELNKLEAKVRYSGFDRTDSTKVIIELIRDMRALKAELEAKPGHPPKQATFGRPYPIFGATVENTIVD